MPDKKSEHIRKWAHQTFPMNRGFAASEQGKDRDSTNCALVE